LIGITTRIAQSKGLHKDGGGLQSSAFECGMRRRLWWQILSLEMRASEDRGTETALEQSYFDTTMHNVWAG